jgi:molybdopterin converting factor small subunit
MNDATEMMKMEDQESEIRVKFFGFIIDVVKKPEITIKISRDYSVKEFLEYLGQKFGQRFNERVFTDCGDILDHIRVSVGDEMIDKEKYNEKLIKTGMNGETVKLFVFSSQMGG